MYSPKSVSRSGASHASSSSIPGNTSRSSRCNKTECFSELVPDHPTALLPPFLSPPSGNWKWYKLRQLKLHRVNLWLFRTSLRRAMKLWNSNFLSLKLYFDKPSISSTTIYHPMNNWLCIQSICLVLPLVSWPCSPHVSHFEWVAGKHLRHALDHYALLLDCLSNRTSTVFSYDTRVRDTPMESSRLCAKKVLMETIAKLDQVVPNANPDQEMTLNAITPHMHAFKTTIGREVSSVSSHSGKVIPE